MNRDLLKSEMVKKNISINDMCEKLGISRSSFYRKCNEKTQFTYKEIQDIVKFLQLDSPMDIFFADYVS